MVASESDAGGLLVTDGPNDGGIVVNGGTPGVVIPDPETESRTLPTSSATAHMDIQQNRVKRVIVVFIV